MKSENEKEEEKNMNNHEMLGIKQSSRGARYRREDRYDNGGTGALFQDITVPTD